METVTTSRRWIRHAADPQLVELIRVEHEEIERRFTRVMSEARRGDWTTCHEVWRPFVNLLSRHMEFEDNQLLPVFEMDGEQTLAMGNEIRRQHEDLRWRVSNISTRINAYELNAEEMEQFMEAMRSHVQYEDLCFHPWVAKQLGLREDDSRIKS